MSHPARRPPAVNHKRNLVVIVTIVAALWVGLNAYNAYGCLSQGGELQWGGMGFGCYLDFSGR